MKTCKDFTKGGELKKECVKGSAPLKTTFISPMGGKGGVQRFYWVAIMVIFL